MKEPLSFLQNVQSAYSSLTGLTLVMIEPEGREITKITGHTPFTEYIYKTKVTRDNFAVMAESLMRIKKTVMIDSRVGPKILVTPIFVNQSLRYFIIGGFFLEKGTSENVLSFIKEAINDEYEILAAGVNSLLELNTEEIEEKKQLLNDFSGIISEHLSLSEEIEGKRKISSFFTGTIENIISGRASRSSFIEGINPEVLNVDFIGTAIEQSADEFIVEAVRGEYPEHIGGTSYYTGEGVLGQALASGKCQFWNETGNHPRFSMFNYGDRRLKTFFCTPLQSADGTSGLLFAGSYSKELDKNEVAETFEMYGALISMLSTHQNLNEEHQNHLMKLSTFNEIFRVITTVEDIKRVLYILVDISINLLRGPFASIIYKPGEQKSNVEIISRGLSTEQINNYGKAAAERTLCYQQQEASDTGKIEKTSWGNDVLELPLIFDNIVYGMLCVGLSPGTNPEKYKAFLASLATAGGIAIHLRLNAKGYVADSRSEALLQNALEELDPAKYNFYEQVSELLDRFTDSYPEYNKKLLNRATKLIPFSINIIDKHISDRNLFSLLQSFHQAPGQQLREEAAVLKAAIHYLDNDRERASIDGLEHIEKDIRSKFRTFLNQQSYEESEIILIPGEGYSDSENLKERNQSLKQSLNLSAREFDVMNLVLKGHSNSEIAGILFISDHTVKNHMTKILHKLNVSDRSQAIAKVYQMGYSPV